VLEKPLGAVLFAGDLAGGQSARQKGVIDSSLLIDLGCILRKKARRQTRRSAISEGE
jgi:hypothetical protein